MFEQKVAILQKACVVLTSIATGMTISPAAGLATSWQTACDPTTPPFSELAKIENPAGDDGITISAQFLPPATPEAPPAADQPTPPPLSGRPPERVVILAHGMNLRPTMMDALGGVIAESNAVVYRIALAGHRSPDGSGGDGIAQAEVTRDGWLLEMRRMYCIARAAWPGLPVHLVGFSLGGLLALDLLINAEPGSVDFATMVLLAPAIAPSSMTGLVRLLQWWPSLKIPSLAPDRWRAATYTTVAQWRALRDSYVAWRDTRHAQIATPTLVIIDPADELVSVDTLADTSVTNRFTQYELRRFAKEPRGKSSPAPHHMLVDPESMLPQNWIDLTSAVTSFQRR